MRCRLAAVFIDFEVRWFAAIRFFHHPASSEVIATHYPPTDCLVIGAGAIGLSVAYELATRGRTVRVVDRGRAGRSASWAASGVLPAVSRTGEYRDELDQLKTISTRMFPEWVSRLQRDSGVDVGLRRTGGLHLSRGIGESASLAVDAAEWEAIGILCDPIESPEAWLQMEPALGRGPAGDAPPVDIRSGYRLPDEMRVDTRRYIDALIAACRNRGVQIVEQMAVNSLEDSPPSLVAGPAWSAIATGPGDKIVMFPAAQICLTAGSWTGGIAETLGLHLDIRPYRGQIVQFRTPSGLIRHVLNEGPNYLVPRCDGMILAGSTVEDVGFDERTTAQAIDEITNFARALIPGLQDAPIVASWAGLRPGTGDAWPFLGKSGLPNCYVAAGHFRSGLILSPMTATAIGQLMHGDQPEIDLAPFRCDRK